MVNTYQWFREHTYNLEDDYNPHDRVAAFQRAIEAEKFPLGVFYLNPQKPSFEENVSAYQTDPTPVIKRNLDRKDRINALLLTKR